MNENQLAQSSKLSPKIRTGVHGLDDILGGGLPANHVYLLEGSPGTGKTTLALQFLLEGVKNGEAALYVTLSETKVELEEVAASHGWSLDGMSLQELEISQDSIMPDGQYTFFHPSEVELGESTKTLVEAVDRVRPVRVVFDSLSEMRLLAKDPLRYRRQILGLKQFFVGKKCTVFLLDDLTSKDSDLQPQSLAHGVITLDQSLADYGSERRRLRVSKLRGVRFRGGYHDFRLQTGGLRVYPRLIASEHRSIFDKESVPSGLAKLDLLLGGGLERGSSNLFVGPAGSGKSSLSTQFACAAAERGERSVFFIFDEVLDTFVTRSEALGMPVERYIASGLMTVRQIDPADTSPGEFANRIRRAVEEVGSRVIVIDSLNGYTLSMPEERFLTAQLHELLSFLAQRGVITILIASEHGIIAGPTFGQDAINVSYLADTAVHMRLFESQGRIRKAISVIKKRSGPHENSIRELTFGSSGVTVGEPLENFQGVLTGIPTFIGETSELMNATNGK